MLLAVHPNSRNDRPRKGRLMRRLLLALVVIASACALDAGTPASAATPTTITLVTHDSFAVSKSVLRRVHEADRHHGEGPAVRRRGRRAQPGRSSPSRTRSATCSSASTTRSSPARSTPASSRRTRRARCRPCLPRTSSTPRTASRPIDHGDVCINYDKQWFADKKVGGADDARRPHQARVQGPARRREPGDVVARARVPARDHRASTATTAGATTGASCARNDVKVVDGWERRTTATSPGRQPGHVPARRVVRVEPAGRGVLLEAAAEDRRPIGTMLDSCFRQVEFAGVLKGTAHRGRGAQARRLHALRDVPGRHPAPDVRVPGARRHAAARRCSRSSPRCRPTPLSLPPAEIGAHRDAWIEQWTDTVLR